MSHAGWVAKVRGVIQIRIHGRGGQGVVTTCRRSPLSARAATRRTSRASDPQRTTGAIEMNPEEI
jgi:hypothetical protein